MIDEKAIEEAARVQFEENLVRCDIPRMGIRTAKWEELGLLKARYIAAMHKAIEAYEAAKSPQPDATGAQESIAAPVIAPECIKALEDSIRILASAILEMSRKVAVTWDYDGETLTGTGVNLSLESELQKLGNEKTTTQDNV